MAPESERATINVCPVHGDTGNEPCAICYGLLVKPRETNLNFQTEPTLTCSEVVERLLEECHHVGMPVTCHFSRSLALAILHSWREQIIKENKNG
jgi:hypothetical protein